MNNDNQTTGIGRWVAYRPIGQPHTTGIGRIHDLSHPAYVWVVFDGPKPYWDTGSGEPTPIACPRQTLRFITMRTDGGFDEIFEGNSR
jgi:hypothetical protein